MLAVTEEGVGIAGRARNDAGGMGIEGTPAMTRGVGIAGTPAMTRGHGIAGRARNDERVTKALLPVKLFQFIQFTPSAKKECNIHYPFYQDSSSL